MPPEDLRYTSEHEWVRRESDGSVTVGITDFAATALGDVVFISLPDIGLAVSPGQVLGEVESTKSVSEIYAPLGGEIVERNDALENQPDLVNTDPYGDGWMVRVSLADAAAYDQLLDADAYAALTG